MGFLTLLRLLTITIAVVECAYTAPLDWLTNLLNPSVHIAPEVYSGFHTAGTFGIFITATVSVALTFFVPRWPAASVLLFWSFLLMGLSLLTRLQMSYWLSSLPFRIWVPSYAADICFALPPLIMAAILRQPFVQLEITRHDPPGV